VTHIAPGDEDSKIIGEPLSDKGTITIAGRTWGICGSFTAARFATTTEVYPDSPKASPEQCNVAQATVVLTGVKTALSMSA